MEKNYAIEKKDEYYCHFQETETGERGEMKLIGEPKYIKVDAEPLYMEDLKSLDLFIHRSVADATGLIPIYDVSLYCVSEGVTGMTISKADTRQEAINKARSHIYRDIGGEQRVLSMLNTHVVEGYISPRYRKRD